MAKLFCVSDIHGFYDELIAALNEAGFDKDNPEHWLISCGDHFDRGWQPVEVMRFLRSLPRKVIIKGNHEQLLKECCDNGYPESYDYSNGTVNTVVAFSSKEDEYFADAASRTWKRVKPFIDEMVNYFETEKYIFVHSWIPLTCKDNLPKYYTRNRVFEFNPNWRDANQEEWDAAMWGNPFDMAEKGFNQTGKTIVFGHWNCSAGWAKDENRSEFGADAKFDPYHGDGFISIDGCVAHTKKCNVLVLEDNFTIQND